MRNVISLVLGGGRGTRLYPLTKFRSKPAVPLAGKYRLIDIPLSNCINSGINRIYVLTQFLSVSLHRHIRQTYRFDHFSGGFVEILAAQQMTDDAQRLVSRHGRRRPQAAPLYPAAGHRLRADPLRRPALPHGLSRPAEDAHRIEGRRHDRRHSRHARAGQRLRHHADRRQRPRARAFSKSRRPTRRPTSCGWSPPGSTPAASPATAAI